MAPRLNMIVYSWNMLYRNRALERALDFIATSEFDIFCLQEVPPETLERLKTLPVHLASVLESEKVFADRSEKLYTVTLSRYPILATETIRFEDSWGEPPLRTRLFTRLMRPLHYAPMRERAALVADIDYEGMRLRVMNLHLMLTHPTWRAEEFERAMLAHDRTLPTIVCGDFNILEKPHITPLNWLMGGRLSDALRFSRERTLIEERFVAHELVNTLRGAVTHPLSRSQLDHILVSRHFSVQSAAIIPDRHGSDHHPIRVELA